MLTYGGDKKQKPHKEEVTTFHLMEINYVLCGSISKLIKLHKYRISYMVR